MLRGYLRLLRNNRNYRLLWIAQVISQVGDWFYALAVYNLLLDLTGNRAESVGLAVVLQVLPQTLVAPASGALNDRLRRKRIMIGADLGRFLIVLGMLAVRSPGTVWLVYPLLFLETIGAAFFEPAHTAVVPNIVPEVDLLAANALGAMTWSFCLAIGGALGGVTAVLLGRDAVFLLNAFSFLVSAWLIRRMRFEEPHAAAQAPLRLRDLVDYTPVVEGARHIASDRRILYTVFVKGGIGLMGANNLLLPILGQREFPVRIGHLDAEGAGTLGMSLLMGARGAGSLLGPLVGNRLAEDRHSRLRLGILVGFVLGAAGYLVIGASASMAVAIVALTVAHAGASANWVFSTTLLQFYTTDRFRGRVFATEVGLCTLAISAGSYLAGVAIDHGAHPRAVAGVMGAVLLLPALGWAWALRKMKLKEEPK